MNEQEVQSKVVEILRPFVKSSTPPEAITPQTTILGDLRINSARLVDIVLEMEDVFGIAVSDEEADKVETVGDAVNLILKAKAA